MKSRIYARELQENKDKHRNAKLHYYPAIFEMQDGKQHRLLFTEKELAKAEERADKNPEDFPEESNKAWWMFF